MELSPRDGALSRPQPFDVQQIRDIRLSNIHPMKNQPRQHFDEKAIEELSGSIKAYGVIQPLIVTENGVGEYQLIAGERRWRAAKLAGLSVVPCIVRDSLREHTKLELALIENIQREELSPVDEAKALQQLVDNYSYTQDEVAQKIGKERSTVSNALRLLSLPHEILDDLQQKKMTSGHARALCAVESRPDQLAIRDLILSKKLSVRQTEDLIKKYKNGLRSGGVSRSEDISPDLRHLCDLFKGHLGTKVKISGEAARGKIEISYYSLEDLERISDLMLGNPLMPRK